MDIDLMIQSDRYLTDEEKEQRATRQEASNYNVGDVRLCRILVSFQRVT